MRSSPARAVKKTSSRRRHLRVAELVLAALAPLLWSTSAAAEAPSGKPTTKSAREPRRTGGAEEPAPQEASSTEKVAAPEAEKRPAQRGESTPDAATPDDVGKARDEETSASDDEKETELPLGVATDENGTTLVAVHFRGLPGTHYLVGPPSALVDTFGNRGHPRLDVDELTPLCTSPCARWLYPGSYTLALSDNGNVARVPALLSVSAPAEVDGEYHSRWLLRSLGWATMGAGVVAGTLLITSSVGDCGSRDGTCLQKQGNVFLGAGAILVGLTGGLLLTQMDDRATASVKPASPALGEPR